MNIGCNLENNMERKIVKFKVPAVKHRAHYVLFADDSPFKPKVVQVKINTVENQNMFATTAPGNDENIIAFYFSIEWLCHCYVTAH